MNNAMQPLGCNLLRNRLCEFCYFVRGRRDQAHHPTRTGVGRHASLHNNKNNNIIYISRVEGIHVHNNKNNNIIRIRRVEEAYVPRGGIA